MTTTLLDHNKLIPCPKSHEESWKRTNPEIFFLPDAEILNFQGQNALENKNKLNPWKVCFRDFKQVNSILQQIESTVGKESIKFLQEEIKRLVVIDISHGMADVYMSPEIKSHIEFVSAPWDIKPISKDSSIALALASRLKVSSPHKITITVSGRSNEVPLFVVLNHLNPNFSQSYGFFNLILKKNTKAELISLEGGSSFSMFRQQLELEEHAVLTQFWLNCSYLGNMKSHYLERIVTLAENAKFKDAQIFIPKANMRINSRIQYNGTKSSSESGGVVFANEGKFDYEPVQEHFAPHSKSALSLKIILNKKARASFQGLVIAQKEAQKCEAKQENKNILLSKQCRVDSEPRLEILPHDIICKHGSATGEIDEKQLYYLQSRGFNFAQSQQIILKSFSQSAFGFLEEESTFQKIVESTLTTILLPL